MPAAVSVIIPTYNQADYIEQSIKSVLSQTEQNYEIIIMDDCSCDSTKEIVQEYVSDKIRYFCHDKNLGPGKTFNDGLAKAQYEYVTLIASDDILFPTHLQNIVQAFTENPDLEVLFPQLKFIDEKNRLTGRTLSVLETDKYKLLNKAFYYGNIFPSPGIAFKKSLFDRIAAFNPSLILNHDYDLNTRVVMNANFSVNPFITVGYRRFTQKSNLSAYNTVWSEKCHKTEYCIIRDLFLDLPTDELKKIFPQFSHISSTKYTAFLLLREACLSTDVDLYEWGFSRTVQYLLSHPNFFYDNPFAFEYKDYIKLYKTNTKNIIGRTHKEKLYNTLKTIIKKAFNL